MIVLDTNAWIRWVADPDLLTAAARKAIEDEESRRGLVVSVISAWEVAVKARKRKLDVGPHVETWVERAAGYPGVVVYPLELEDAVASTNLPGRLHDDPADRMIIALARRLGVPVVTADRAIRRYRHVETIW
ncbi:MAG: type II toxin-antitoxin system VapC family toxin [Gemmatimonadetes bacterium]|nr:type II toxin-antitoxin system VapC family toxin [Gemmatimonadota bacterium]